VNFEDEPYVRKYTRKTVTNRLLGWEGRAVLDAMLGEFDPAGIFAIRGDVARCISAVTEIPLEVVQAALARLIETETWVVTAREIVWPTYEEAQNCCRSDRVRQRESRRARAAALSVTARTPAVTNVTTGHKPAPAVTNVTKCHSPSLPSFPPPSHPSSRRDPPIGPPGDVTPPAPKSERKKRSTALPEDLAPNASVMTLARELAVALETELPAFIDHHRAKGSVFSDWQAALRTWIRNAARYGPAKRVPGSRPYQPQDDRLQRQADRITMLRKQEAAEEAAAKGTHP
jgi:hypothetical protein